MMNINDFELTENTTIKEILQYAKAYCPQGESVAYCSDCKVNKVCCTAPLNEWGFNIGNTYLEDFMLRHPKCCVDEVRDNLMPCVIYPELNGQCKDSHGCQYCWELLKEEYDDSI